MCVNCLEDCFSYTVLVILLFYVYIECLTLLQPLGLMQFLESDEEVHVYTYMYTY